MKRTRYIAVAVWIVISFALAGLSISAERGIQVKRVNDLSHESGKLGEYKALIIGINDYKGPKIPDLETPINDATTIAKVLKEKYGFKVELLLDRNATREAIYRGLRRLAASTKPNDSVLIYFAGHGDLDRTYDDGWWIPADAIGGNPLTYLDNVQVQKAMKSMKARHVLLISDSCYSGTLFGKARSLPRVIDDKYYLSLYNEKSRWGMTSGNKTPVFDQGTGGHSVFAYQLIKELEKSDKPFVSTQEIYTRIAPVIANNSEQTPLCRPILNTGDQGGEFVFVAAVNKEALADIKAPSATSPRKADIDVELEFWQSIKNSKAPAFFMAYLEKYPKGSFASIAEITIEKLNLQKELDGKVSKDTETDKPAEKKVVPAILPASKKAKLFVETEPKDARVRILNVQPKFYQGIELDAGKYHIEVSNEGYVQKKEWVTVDSGQEKKLTINLIQKNENASHKLASKVKPNEIRVQLKGDGYELFWDDKRVGYDLKVNRKQAIHNLQWNMNQYPNKKVEGYYNGKKIHIGIGYDIIDSNGEIVYQKTEWRLQQAIEHLRGYVQQEYKYGTHAYYNSKLISSGIGYELFWDGKLVGTSPEFSRKQAIHNLQWNMNQYPNKKVEGYYNGKRIKNKY